MINKNACHPFRSPPRQSESEITQRERDRARPIQVIIEDSVLKITHNDQKELESNRSLEHLT